MFSSEFLRNILFLSIDRNLTIRMYLEVSKRLIFLLKWGVIFFRRRPCFIRVGPKKALRLKCHCCFSYKKYGCILVCLRSITCGIYYLLSFFLFALLCCQTYLYTWEGLTVLELKNHTWGDNWWQAPTNIALRRRTLMIFYLLGGLMSKLPVEGWRHGDVFDRPTTRALRRPACSKP